MPKTQLIEKRCGVEDDFPISIIDDPTLSQV